MEDESEHDLVDSVSCIAGVLQRLEKTGLQLPDVAHALHRLGNADAETPQGGLEALGGAILEASQNIATALDHVADALDKR